MKALFTDDCDVGEFVVLYRERGITATLRPGRDHAFPDYAAAERAAREVAKELPGTSVYIAQISGQLRAVPEVYEVKHKP